MDITEQTYVRQKQDVSMADLEGEVVLLDIQTSHYFGMNEVGKYIWELLQEGNTVYHVITALQKQCDVDADVLRQDVLAFIQQLTQRGLVNVSETEQA